MSLGVGLCPPCVLTWYRDCCARGYTGVVELLLKGGARVDVVDTEDNTVLELLFAAMTLGGANRRTGE